MIKFFISGPRAIPARTRPCTRSVSLGSFRYAGRVGAQQLRLSGRVAGHALTAGSYALRATPASPALSVAFAVT
ncbi:MAG TPA: hypothetical protein VIJ51_17780 [Solirubrobacteraceae bacterium]